MTTGPENFDGSAEQSIHSESAAHAGSNGTQNPQPAPEPAHTSAPVEEASNVSPIVFGELPAGEHVIIDEPEETPDDHDHGYDHGHSSLQSLLSVVVIALFVITFIVQAFQIPSESMEKTLLIGDYLLVDKLHFGAGRPWERILPYRDIQRGDIIVFHYPVDPAQHFVKRVVGVPGDHIRILEKNVYVNGFLTPESYVMHTLRNYDPYRDNFPLQPDYTGQIDRRWRTSMHRYMDHGEIIVPPDQYFAMGDNRDQSLDSRYWGFVPRENIEGRPLVIYLSLREGREPRPYSADTPSFGSGSVLTHVWQFARWDRMFHLIR